MRRGLNVLAIVALVLTIAAAAAVLYGMNTLVPQVTGVTTSVTPAAQAQDTLDAILRQREDGLFMGKEFDHSDMLIGEESHFVTYTVRLHNLGFFPAEWISLDVSPLTDETGGDILQLENGGANVLYSGAQGDLSVTILTTMDDPAQRERTLQIDCYVLGRKQTIRVQTN